MREMKDSGIEWIGKVPVEWKIDNPQYHFSQRKDRAKQGMVQLTASQKYGVITQTEYMERTGANIVTVQKDFDILKLVCAGDFVIHMRSFQGGLEYSEKTGSISSAYVMLIPSNTIREPRYYKWFFKSSNYIDALSSTSNLVRDGQAMRWSNFIQLPILFPPAEEQQRIADFLDAKCAEIDALTADIQTQIDTLEQYKRSVITETVTKGLNPNAEMKDSGIEWVGKMPLAWDAVPNKYLMYKVKNICPVYNGEDILSLTTNGVIIRDLNGGGKMPTSFDGYQKVTPGNLLMCLFDIDVTPRCIGLVKNFGLTSPAYSQFVMRTGAYAPYYYYYYLMVDYTKELLHMAKNLRHSLTEDQLGAIKAPNPPYEEQVQIAEFLDKKCVEINLVIEDKNRQLATLDEYKKSLIFEYVTGKKEVPTS
jgi:type I restriction enzyme S subunit